MSCIEYDWACFSTDAAYSGSETLAKRTVSDNILKDRPYKIAINTKCGGCKRGLIGMVYKFFEKKRWAGTKVSIDEELA